MYAIDKAIGEALNLGSGAEFLYKHIKLERSEDVHKIMTHTTTQEIMQLTERRDRGMDFGF